MMQKFHVDMSHKLLFIFKLEVAYLCTLLKIISPTQLFVCFGGQRLPGSAIKCPWMNANLIVVVSYSVGTLSTPVGKRA